MSKAEDFTAASTPVVAFLRKYGNPHSVVVITQTNASMYSGEMGMPYPYPEEDPSPEFTNPKPVGFGKDYWDAPGGRLRA